jgi:hypothetical protein
MTTKAKSPELDEFWIADGALLAADGDAGPGSLNHVHVVVRHAWRNQLLPALKQAPGYLWWDLAAELQQFDEADGVDVIAAREYLHQWADGAQRSGELTDAQTDDIVSTLSQVLSAQLPRTTLDVAFGNWGERESEMVRDYGRRYLGWIRVVGENIDFWALDYRTLKSATHGLSAIYKRSVRKRTFLVQVIGTRQFFRNVPWQAIAYADPVELAPYRYIPSS